MVLSRAGAQVHEMERHHKFGMCCGAGGGRMWIEEDPDKRVNLLRTEQALQTDPEVIAVSCPYCMTMLGDGIKAKQLGKLCTGGCAERLAESGYDNRVQRMEVE
jgi:Fe-S oxidoreductase